jgi:hypothetical protein
MHRRHRKQSLAQNAQRTEQGAAAAAQRGGTSITKRGSHRIAYANMRVPMLRGGASIMIAIMLKSQLEVGNET